MEGWYAGETETLCPWGCALLAISWADYLKLATTARMMITVTAEEALIESFPPAVLPAT